jgi:hypothetical protein
MKITLPRESTNPPNRSPRHLHLRSMRSQFPAPAAAANATVSASGSESLAVSFPVRLYTTPGSTLVLDGALIAGRGKITQRDGELVESVRDVWML